MLEALLAGLCLFLGGAFCVRLAGKGFATGPEQQLPSMSFLVATWTKILGLFLVGLGAITVLISITLLVFETLG